MELEKKIEGEGIDKARCVRQRKKKSSKVCLHTEEHTLFNKSHTVLVSVCGKPKVTKNIPMW